MNKADLRTVVQESADLYEPGARETILFENFDKHVVELGLIDAALQPDGALLDLGGGVGTNLIALRKRGHRGRLVLVDRLVEYDAANRMGSKARAEALLRDYDIELKETNFWPDYQSGFPDGSFDMVTCFDVIEHLPGHPQRQLRELARILKRDGQAIIGAPNATSLMKRVKVLTGTHPYTPFEAWTGDEYFGHIREYTAQEYRALVEMSGLTAVRMLRSAAIPRTRARNRYHRKRHALFSPVTVALQLAYAIEALVPALRHSIYVVATKNA